MSSGPEAIARDKIDAQLEACGWVVQDRSQINIDAGLGVAVREFPLAGGDEADYLLYAGGTAIGVVEAKPEGHTLTGVEPQSAKYTKGLPSHVPTYRRPLPFGYETTGVETRFTKGLDPEPRSREVFTFHRPETLQAWAEAADQLRHRLTTLPPLITDALWPKQTVAIHNLERSLAAARPRSLIQMATGSGKTFTAVNFVYRLIKHADARRAFRYGCPGSQWSRKHERQGNAIHERQPVAPTRPDLRSSRTGRARRPAKTALMCACLRTSVRGHLARRKTRWAIR